MDQLLEIVGPVLSWKPLLAILVGTLFGLIFGILPGLGSVLAISIALPFTFAMDSISSISLMLAIYCSSVYGGSLSAILINTPGTPQSATTMFDGFPMTKRGEADLAIGWATLTTSTLVKICSDQEVRNVVKNMMIEAQFMMNY